MLYNIHINISTYIYVCVYVCNHHISSYEYMKTSDQRRNLSGDASQRGRSPLALANIAEGPEGGTAGRNGFRQIGKVHIDEIWIRWLADSSCKKKKWENQILLK